MYVYNQMVFFFSLLQALKTYEAEPNSREIGKLEKNARKNRYSDVLPCMYFKYWKTPCKKVCLQNHNLRKSSKDAMWFLSFNHLPCHNFADDHNRVLLKETASATGSDYINASYVVSLQLN